MYITDRLKRSVYFHSGWQITGYQWRQTQKRITYVFKNKDRKENQTLSPHSLQADITAQAAILSAFHTCWCYRTKSSDYVLPHRKLQDWLNNYLTLYLVYLDNSHQLSTSTTHFSAFLVPIIYLLPANIISWFCFYASPLPPFKTAITAQFPTYLSSKRRSEETWILPCIIILTSHLLYSNISYCHIMCQRWSGLWSDKCPARRI